VHKRKGLLLGKGRDVTLRENIYSSWDSSLLKGGVNRFGFTQFKSMLPPVVNYGFASSSSWSKSICNPEIGILRIRGPLMIAAPYQR
jgi:hypothetical protein